MLITWPEPESRCDLLYTPVHTHEPTPAGFSSASTRKPPGSFSLWIAPRSLWIGKLLWIGWPRKTCS
jgi:hypothetical protein